MKFEHIRSIKLKSAGKTFCNPDWSWDTSVFTDFDLWLVLDGEGTLASPVKTYPLQAGDCFILRKGEHYVGRQNPDFPLVVIYAHFDFYDEEGKVIQNTISEIPRFQRKLKNYHFLTQLLDRMIKALFARQEREASEWFRVAFMELLSQDQQASVGMEQTEIVNFIERIAQDVREHPGEHYSLKQVARKACYSPDHFSRLFKRVTGYSFREFILLARMDTAKFLLKSSNYSITRISEILGYHDVYLFSKQFKQREGVPPTNFRSISTIDY